MCPERRGLLDDHGDRRFFRLIVVRACRCIIAPWMVEPLRTRRILALVCVLGALTFTGCGYRPVSEAERKAVMAAINRRDTEEVKKLIRANPAVVYYHGGDDWPMEAAVLSRDKAMLELLIRNGARFDSCSRGWTALHWAVFDGQEDIVELLIGEGADIGARSAGDVRVSEVVGMMQTRWYLIPKGTTPLGIAKIEGNHDIVALLRSHGAKQ